MGKRQIAWVAVVSALLVVAIVAGRLAAMNAASHALKSGDYKAARVWLQPLAHVGDSVAQNFLGVTYALAGDGEYDVDKALYWFRRSQLVATADLSDAAAPSAFWIGQQYAEGGNGVTRDQAKADQWFAIARRGGFVGKPDSVEK